MRYLTTQILVLISFLGTTQNLDCIFYKVNGDSTICQLNLSAQWTPRMFGDEIIFKDKLKITLPSSEELTLTPIEISKLKVLINKNWQIYELKSFKKKFRLMRKLVDGNAKLYSYTDYNPWNQYNMFTQYYLFEGNNKNPLLSVVDIWGNFRSGIRAFFDNCKPTLEYIDRQKKSLSSQNIIDIFNNCNDLCK